MTARTRVALRGFASALAAAIIGLAVTVTAKADDPIRIGFGMALTGPLAANGKSALVARKSGKRRSTPKADCSAAR